MLCLKHGIPCLYCFAEPTQNNRTYMHRNDDFAVSTNAVELNNQITKYQNIIKLCFFVFVPINPCNHKCKQTRGPLRFLEANAGVEVVVLTQSYARLHVKMYNDFSASFRHLFYFGRISMFCILRFFLLFHCI